MSQGSASKNENQKTAVELFILSFVSLYLELLVIRWFSSDIRAFTVFRTFPLITCFVGLGVGCAMGRDRHFKFTGLALLLMAALVKIPDLLGIWQWMPFPSVSVFDWAAIKLTDQLWKYMLFFMPFLILILSGPFAVMVTLGSRIGVLFNNMKPLPAYCINIGGAIAGSLTFALLSFAGLSPWQLIVPAAVMLLVYLLKDAGWQSLAALAATVLVAAWSPALEAGSTITAPGAAINKADRANWSKTFWSPYHRLDVIEQLFVGKSEEGQEVVPIGVTVLSNRAVYQVALDLHGTTFDMERFPVLKDFLAEYGRRYELPFLLKPYSSVLIVGAGSGMDVTEALRNGATSVDAVDIDPVILDVGRKYNLTKPYADNRVEIICDDARNFFNRCNKKYDLIVFSHLDSQTVIGQGASVRLDNYVYTRESFKKALSLLKPDGLMVVSFATVKDWFRDRIYATIKAAAGYDPLVIIDKRSKWFIPNTFFVAGNAVEHGAIKVPESQNAWLEADSSYSPQFGTVLTDDWPYLYVAPTRVDLPYLLVIAEVLLLSMFAGRNLLFKPAEPRSWQLFFLGAAFLLLELQAISRLSLLFGPNWLTSAVVINGILVMILFANLIVMRAGEFFTGRENLLYLALMLSLLVSYLLPVGELAALSAGTVKLGFVLVTFLTILPMFVAGIIFAVSFAQVANPARCLAFNLLGSVIGAMLEYLSNYWGINSLVLVAAILYLSSWWALCSRAGKLTPDLNPAGD